MVDFLNTAKAYSEIEGIVSRAENDLVLISPYLQIPRPFMERLHYASDRKGVNIVIVCRRESLKREEFNDLKNITRLDLLDSPHLHAKCFYNEARMVVTSLNLYKYSQINNREMGLLLTKETDASAFDEAVEEAEFIIETSRPIRVNKPLQKERRESGRSAHFQTRSTVSDVLSADVGASLKTAFPTFSKLFGVKEQDNMKLRD